MMFPAVMTPNMPIQGNPPRSPMVYAVIDRSTQAIGYRGAIYHDKVEHMKRVGFQVPTRYINKEKGRRVCDLQDEGGQGLLGAG